MSPPSATALLLTGGGARAAYQVGDSQGRQTSAMRCTAASMRQTADDPQAMGGDPGFTRELMALGRADTLAQRDAVCRFFGWPAT